LLALLPLTALEAQLQPPTTGGYAALDYELRRLGHRKRVLMIAAHPDDEDTELLAVLVRGMGAEAAYLSLNRGEGGQNLIGNELGEALGLLRTEELLAARRLEGGGQFFTRAYDFGFSKTLDDTWAHWPRDSVLKDVVRIVRRYRPQIVVSIFSGTPRDGHAQHQAAGWAAQQAFRVAGDAAVFPELLSEEGLPAYQPDKLYRSTRFDSAATTLRINGGVLDPAEGQSYHQIAMRGRSLHRSQDMGQLQRIGPSEVRLQLLEDRTGRGADGLWSGLDTTLGAWPLVTALRPEARGSVMAQLEQYVARVDSARALVSSPVRGRLVDLLARATRDLAAARRQLGDGLPGSALRQAKTERTSDGALFDSELSHIETARILSLDLIADGQSLASRVTPGQTFGLSAQLWNAGERPAAATLCVGPNRFTWRQLLDSTVRADLRAGLGSDLCLESGMARAAPSNGPAGGGDLPGGALVATRLEVTIPESEDYTTPYFLRLPRAGDLYQWDPEDRTAWGFPFEGSLLTLAVRTSDDSFQGLPREIAFRGNDQASGEYRRPVLVVPRVDVRLDPDEEIWPLKSPVARVFTVALTHGGHDTVSGMIALRLPPGWAEPAPRRFRLGGENERITFAFSVRPPARAKAGAFEVAAIARDDGGRVYDVGLRSVDHPHIRPRTWARRAAATVRLTDLMLPRLRRVAYIRGAADRVPEALADVGLPIEVIPATALGRDLSRYDVIVVGPRAYEADTALPGNNDRLLAFARAGGTVLVQYQQYSYFLGDYAPYKLTVGSRPPGAPNAAAAVTSRRDASRGESTALLSGHDRVTDETAPVRLVAPESPVVRRPNRIVAADWEGWVQERGLYFARSWDRAWRPVLELHDPGDAPLEGGLLISQVGKGTYVYTGLSFFRQLPAGVPGAWRLFANLLALGESRSGPARPRPVPRDTLNVERE
jgi:LmbE family N-acetylglucosaminyl deacetylase